MLFDKNVDSSCSYCRFGNDAGSGRIICEKYGFVEAGGSCRRFKYDPLKRIPEAPRPSAGRDYSEEDFSIM